MLLSEIFDAAMWKTNLARPCNAVQYVLSKLKRGEQWNDKMQEQVREVKYVLQVMIVVAKRVGLDQELTPDEAELFDGKWTAGQNILDILDPVLYAEDLNAENLLAKCTEALGLINILLAQHELPSSYDWLKTFFHWLSEPFLLSAHMDLAAQRDAPPFSGLQL